MTLNLLLKLLVAIVIVLSPIHKKYVANWQTPHGYANFGFKAITANYQKYNDRNLYISLRKLGSTLEKEPPSHRIYLNQNFAIQKAGNELAECEDIWEYAEHDGMIAIALSDGATESSFAREWAQKLVTAFVNQDNRINLHNDLATWLLGLQTIWQKWLSQQNLSWFAKRKAEQGAFATFLSLEIFSDLQWISLAIGDSCLFVVRDCTLQESFPMHNSQEFNNRPRLVSSYAQLANINTLQALGHAQIGDRFYLTTDAIACWIFKQLEVNLNPWVKLQQINSQDTFVRWVSELRDRHEIVNDDTTLLCLEIQDASKIL